MLVYDDDCASPIKSKLVGGTGEVVKRLKEVAGEDTELWFYEAAGDTEAAVAFSPKNKRCTIMFRGTESRSDAIADVMIFKKKLEGPNDSADDRPDVRVHSGFRGQYYGNVEKLTNDGDVSEALRAKEGEVEDKELEAALFQKVSAQGRRSSCAERSTSYIVSPTIPSIAGR